MKTATHACPPQRRPRILLVDDDIESSERLVAYLDDFAFDTHHANDAGSVMERLAEQPADLVVMDVVLGRVNGLSLLQDIRRSGPMPVMILSRRSEPADRIVGLELGADDYLSKPCEPRELLARARAILRRLPEQRLRPAGTQPGEPVGRWELRRDERRLVSPDEETVALSASEYRLLSAFLAAPRMVLSREHLMTHARGRELHNLDRGIDLLVSRLRRKLEDDTATSLMIRTVRGRGYVFEPLVRNGTSARAPGRPQGHATPSPGRFAPAYA
jgi:two-component system OmpR family response regulator